MEWINPKDALPENGQVVLTIDSRIPNTFFMNTFMNTPQRGNCWIDVNGHIFYYGVSYWMSLPTESGYGFWNTSFWLKEVV